MDASGEKVIAKNLHCKNVPTCRLSVGANCLHCRFTGKVWTLRKHKVPGTLVFNVF